MDTLVIFVCFLDCFLTNAEPSEPRNGNERFVYQPEMVKTDTVIGFKTRV